MTYLLLRALWSAWFIGMLLMIIIAVSNSLFAKRPWSARLKDCFVRVGLAVIWPIAMFSTSGRKTLFKQWKGVI